MSAVDRILAELLDGPRTAGDIERATGLRRSTVTSTLARSALVRRVADECHRGSPWYRSTRTARYALTERGRARAGADATERAAGALLADLGLERGP